MYYIDLFKFNEAKNKVIKHARKEPNQIDNFAYFYKCAKMDGWDAIQIRRFDSRQNELLAAEYDALLQMAVPQ